MRKNVTKTLSLILALIMICSTMGIMSLAASGRAFCPECDKIVRDYYFVEQYKEFLRIEECPTHHTHDAEVWRFYYKAYCSLDGVELVDVDPSELYEDVYVCID